MNLSTYLIVIKDFEPNNDWTFLVSLYGPIIGQEAIGLYITLINEAQILKQLNYPKFDQNRLYRIAGMSEEHFLETLKKLGSLKLVKTKINRKTNFKKLEIFNPLEPSEFFANNLFERILAQKIGQENLEALKFIFKEKVDLEIDSDYEDITANFEDIFSEELDEIKESANPETLVIQLQASKKTLLEKMIDLKRLNELLKDKNIQINYNLNKVKKLFNWSLSLYNFDEVSFAKLIIDNYDQKQRYLNFKQFELAVRNYAWYQKSQIQPSRLLKPLLISKNNQPINLDTIKIYDEISVTNFIQELTGESQTSRIQNLIGELKHKFQLNQGGINLCLAYCYLINQRIVPNYLLKLAESLVTNHLSQTREIFSYFTNILIKRQQNKFSQETLVTQTIFDFTNSLHSHFDNDKLQSKL